MNALQIAITVLKSDPALKSVLGDGNSPEDYRVFAVDIPQGFPRPCLVVSIVGETEDQLLAGAGNYYESRVQVQAFADSADASVILGEWVKTALGDVTKQAIAGASNVDIMKSTTDVTDLSEDRSVYRRIMDFTVRWKP